jgi:dTDP-4-dehydrorhamnose reductase
MKILLLGSRGMLGSDCYSVLGESYDVVAPDRKELDITSWDKVIDKLHHVRPHLILNCAAFTDVDACEKDAFTVRKANVEGPRNLAQGSARYECKLIHISSDYIFSGQKSVPQPYFEDDSMDPISAYGKSKMESEIAVKENSPDYIIVRTGWLYGRRGNNFITSLLRNAFNKKKKKPLKVVDDQYGSPTWSYRLAEQIRELIRVDARGTFNATSEGFCTRYSCAERVLSGLKIKASIQACRLKDLAQRAKRPRNCILENRLLKQQGINIMPQWEEDLDTFLHNFGEELIKEAKASSS